MEQPGIAVALFNARHFRKQAGWRKLESWQQPKFGICPDLGQSVSQSETRLVAVEARENE
jgi:hypothetical protein